MAEVRIRSADDLPACVSVLRRVHEVSGYPSRWPADPAGWLSPSGLVAAWVAEADGAIAGHVVLIQGIRTGPLVRATGLEPARLGGVSRLFTDPSARRQGLARALLDTVAAYAVEAGLRPVLDVVADAGPAIALYEGAGWRLAGTETATWTDPDGTQPTLRCYLGP